MDRGQSGTIGVIIVTFRSSDVIEDCLASLIRSDYPDLKIVICDNASPDETVARIRSWAAERTIGFAEYPADGSDALQFTAFAQVTLLRSDRNLGFAGGVNIGLAALRAHSQVGLFWLLNPDCVVEPDTASAYARRAAAGPFALMGGRTVYYETPNRIQSDGGRVNMWTGICRNVNQGLLPDQTVPPDERSIDFISGANLVISRTFMEQAGLMPENYFLYFEEVDWALRRGSLPLVLCPEAIVYHHGGTAIGSGSISRRASGFANYFNYRNRMRFLARFNAMALPVGYAYSMLKIGRLILRGAWEEVAGALLGLHQLAPPKSVASRIAPESLAMAFGRWAGSVRTSEDIGKAS